MSDFDQRLQRAIQRGQRAGSARAEAEAQKAISEHELRSRHSQYRLELSEHIERCLRRLPQHFPGFRFETIVSERGWGAGVSRDDVQVDPHRKRTNYYSRLEMLVRPVSQYFVLDLAAKATVWNRELFNRNHYERLAEVDLESFVELIDFWVLEFAQQYAAKS